MKPDRTMHAAIVIPCLNEEETLATTCASLGFGTGRDGPDDFTYLIIVDNGSEDRSRLVMEQIKERSRPNSVILLHEAERGYVPPRHRGALEVRSLARALEVPETSFLLLQADADTIYSAEYASVMRRVAVNSGDRCLFEGVINPPEEFAQEHAGYLHLCQQVDRSTERCWVDDELDVIVVDAACGFLLESYFAWGGHKREFASNGDEVCAETTRLFMRAKMHASAHRIRVDGAVAWPSRRKVLADPALYFATAGFPRTTSWVSAWRKVYRGPNTLTVFDAGLDDALKPAVRCRQAHSLILFGVLPTYIAKLTGQATGGVTDELDVLVGLLEREIHHGGGRAPGQLIECALSLIESSPELLQNLCPPN